MLLVRLASQPLASKPSQLAKGTLQAMLHEPELQEAWPLLLLQALPQAPQFATFVLRFVSQPFARLPSQLAQGAVHRITQPPFTQPGVPLMEPQVVPQPPQLAGSVAVLTSQPVAGSPSQSA